MDEIDYDEDALRKRDAWYQLYEEMHNHPVSLDFEKEEFINSAYFQRRFFVEHRTATIIGARQSLKIAAAEKMALEHKDVLIYGMVCGYELKKRSNYLHHSFGHPEHLEKMMASGKFREYATVFLTAEAPLGMNSVYEFLVDNFLKTPSAFHPELKIISLLNCVQ